MVDNVNATEPEIEIQNAQNVTPSERKQMLQTVFSNLSTQLRRRPRKKRDLNLRKHIRILHRNRIYKTFKNLIRQAYDDGDIGFKAFNNLNFVIETSQNDLKNEIHIFETYKNNFRSSIKENISLKFGMASCCSLFFFNKMTNSFLVKYEMQTTILGIIKKILNCKNYPAKNIYDWNKITKELGFELEKFENDQKSFLKKYAKVKRLVRTKYVCNVLLNYGYNMTQKMKDFGEIDQYEKCVLDSELCSIKSKFKTIQKDDRNFKGENQSRLSIQDNRKVEHKLGIIFPIFKDLSRTDLEILKNNMILEKKSNIGDLFESNIRMSSFGIQNDLFIYFIYEGVVELTKVNSKPVCQLSSGDVFGTIQLISSDVKIKGVAQKNCTIYKIGLNDMNNLFDKYPMLKNKFYSRAIFDYFKFCTEKLSHTKTKYFQNLRTKSSSYLEDLLINGQSLCFKNTNEFMKHLKDSKYVSMGVFIIKGKFSINHQHNNIKLEKIRKIFNTVNTKNELSIQDDNPLKTRNKRFSNQTGDDTKNFETNDIQIKNDSPESSFDNTNEENIIESGNALEIYPDYIESFKLLSDNLIVYVLEIKKLSFLKEKK